MNFKDIYLCDNDLEILQALSAGKVLRYAEYEVQYLLSLEFVMPYSLSKVGDEYVITGLGIRYLSFYEISTYNSKRTRYYNWITTALALIGVLIGIIALFK